MLLEREEVLWREVPLIGFQERHGGARVAVSHRQRPRAVGKLRRLRLLLIQGFRRSPGQPRLARDRSFRPDHIGDGVAEVVVVERIGRDRGESGFGQRLLGLDAPHLLLPRGVAGNPLLQVRREPPRLLVEGKLRLTVRQARPDLCALLVDLLERRLRRRHRICA